MMAKSTKRMVRYICNEENECENIVSMSNRTFSAKQWKEIYENNRKGENTNLKSIRVLGLKKINGKLEVMAKKLEETDLCKIHNGASPLLTSSQDEISEEPETLEVEKVEETTTEEVPPTIEEVSQELDRKHRTAKIYKSSGMEFTTLDTVGMDSNFTCSKCHKGVGNYPWLKHNTIFGYRCARKIAKEVKLGQFKESLIVSTYNNFEEQENYAVVVLRDRFGELHSYYDVTAEEFNVFEDQANAELVIILEKVKNYQMSESKKRK